MRPDPTKLVALADHGRQLRDEQLSRLEWERPSIVLPVRRVLGRPVDGGR